MIDFDKGIEKIGRFGGSERKAAVMYDGSLYMLKYPDPLNKKKGLMSYKNNNYSEHIGCRIFGSCGFETQETTLGYFTNEKGNRKIVVGCKDFTQYGAVLSEFKSIANAIEDFSRDGRSTTTVENLNLVISQHRMIKEKDLIKEKFWDMFVVDALIANRDRHFGNWGLLEENGSVRFAPIYDCGSSLSAWLSEEEMQTLMGGSGFKNEEYNVMSCYVLNNKRIFYHEIFKSPPEELAAAILRVAPRIDMEVIHGIVDNTPTMPDIRKTYLKAAMDLRYREIIEPALKRLSKIQRAAVHEPLENAVDKAISDNIRNDADIPSGKVSVDMDAAVKAVLCRFDREYAAGALRSGNFRFKSSPAMIDGFMKAMDAALAKKPSMDEQYARAGRRKATAEKDSGAEPQKPMRTTPER